MMHLPQITAVALREQAVGGLLVGYSGGPDSSALLDVLAGLPEARERGLRAIHIHHDLQPQADQWAEHCLAFCAARSIACNVRRVQVRPAGLGPEGDARAARMAAFASALGHGENLLLAHHLDDQVETIVLKLLRGAGPQGLAGMRRWRSFAAGRIGRPWLDVPPAAIRAWLSEHAIDCVDDPANHDPRMTRNWLRQRILPEMHARLPQASTAIVHSARLCADASDYLAQQASAGLPAMLAADGSLDAAAWLAQPAALRALSLDSWLRQRGLDTPTTSQRAQLEHQLAGAGGDKLPHLHWRNTDLRLWRGRLHAVPPLPRPTPDWQAPWRGESLALPLGRLEWLAESTTPTPFAEPLQVRLRHGGEVLRPASGRHRRSLAEIFQAVGLPPWLRPLCPLVYRGEQLLAVADLCTSRAGETCFAALGGKPHWRYHV